MNIISINRLKFMKKLRVLQVLFYGISEYQLFICFSQSIFV